MRAGDPFVTFKAWYRTSRTALLQAESAAKDLERRILARIPTQIAERASKLLSYLLAHPAASFFLFFLLAGSRAIHWLTNPQFYIEDGREFYLPAYTYGISTLTREYASYFHLWPRILSLIATRFPLQFGPLAMETLALAVQAMVSTFIFSPRMAKQIPNVGVRFALAFFVIADPYSNELFANVTHSQWYLGLLSLTLLYSEPGKRWVSQVSDHFVLFLNGLTGPFAPVLCGVSWLKLRLDRSRWVAVEVTTLTAVITVSSILQHPRSGIHHSARPSLLYRMISNQVVYGTLRGFHYTYTILYDAFFNWREFGWALFAVVVILIGLRYSSGFMRALAFLGLYCLVTSLDSRAPWALLGDPGVGERYFFYLDIVFAFCILTLSQSAKSFLVRWCFRAAMVIMGAAIIGEWVYDPPFHRFDYAPQLSGFNQLQPGESIKVMTPIDRKSDKDSWTIDIPKKP